MPQSPNSIKKINELTLMFKNLLSDGKTDEALLLSEKILKDSQSIEYRNHEIEAWIRMERALLGIIGSEDVGIELRWCVDRFSSISSGSALHGLALLNLASWHIDNQEHMMALVTLSDITASAGHPNDIIGLSRLESGRILIEIGDLQPAMRHLWIAMKRLSSENMGPEAIVCAMEWLDIALDNVDESTPRMEERISNAKPRENPGMSSSPSNPEDIKEVVEFLLKSSSDDLSGPTRDDLGLVLDASDLIGEKSWREALHSRLGEIQDPRLIEALQS